MITPPTNDSWESRFCYRLWFWTSVAIAVFVGVVVNATPIQAQVEPASVSAARDVINKGVRSFREKNYEEAIKFFKDATDLDPSMSTAYLYLGTAYSRYIAEVNNLSTAKKATLIEQGLQTLKQALILSPESVEAMSTLSLLYRQKAAIADTESERMKLEAEALSWEAKSLEARKKIGKE